MRFLLYAAIPLFFLLPTRAPAAVPHIAEESLYRDFIENFAGSAFSVLDADSLAPDQWKLALDAAEDALRLGITRRPIQTWIPAAAQYRIPLLESLRWRRLLAEQGNSPSGFAADSLLLQRLEDHMRAHLPSPRFLHELELAASVWQSVELQSLARFSRLANADFFQFYALARSAFIPPTREEIQGLYFRYPASIADFQYGDFYRSPRLFVFCRHDRNYPCLVSLRDGKDQPLRDSSGKLWTQPALGLSITGGDFDERNGDTPQGIFLVEGSMPDADNPVEFGKFRRLVLNFVGASPNEAEQRKLLPIGSQNSLWWQEAVLARDFGRNLFRLHGTGQRNTNPNSAFYPLYPTHGCISQRENTYDGVEYVDQRHMLDAWMRAMGVPATAENELRIQGILYLVEIDDQHGAVLPRDLARYGIE